ncbi:iron complex outermembrane recepter protein [Catalinimonas alkaloidigena]|uniref:Iron complex outermembrane recepter protein n=1 Tax=Catalinimonas alkaloidigena TaxID=1075417 RepID=A0A1G9AMI3_9BACT|nr:TonB-dependent receptor [Catalinimonas alkaloidigena]SDK28589.1 iron complex outermembrane recepter protein [Catalinimonas alkaloidigena]
MKSWLRNTSLPAGRAVGAALVLLLLWGWSRPATAQSSSAECRLSISGQVLDEHDGSVLEFSTLYIHDTGKGASADAEGRFQLTGLCPGTYHITVSHIGCKPLDRTLQLTSDSSFVFRLEHHAELLQEVVISTRPVPIAPVQTEVTLTGRTLQETRGQALGEALTRLPGVSVLQTGPTIFKPVIQGLYGNRIQLINNGVRLESQRWGTEHAPEIDPFLANELKVVKGASAVRYGPEAVGGAIVVNPPTLPTEAGLHGEANLIGFSNSRGGAASASLEGGLNRLEGFGWRIQGSGKRTGDWRAPTYLLSNTGVKELNLTAAAGYQHDRWGVDVYASRFSTELGILRSAHIGNLTDLQDALESGTPRYIAPFTYAIANPRQRVAHLLTKARAYYQSEHSGKWSLQYGGQYNNRREFDIRRGDRSDRPALFMQLATHTLDLNWEQERHAHWRHAAGLTGTLQHNRNRSLITGTLPLVPDFLTRSVGAYWIERYVRDRWELEAGLRGDYRWQQVLTFARSAGSYTADSLIRPVYHLKSLSGSVGAVYHVDEGVVLQSQLGLASRMPTMNELYSQGLHHGTASLERGPAIYTADPAVGVNPDTVFRNEQAYKWINTLTYKRPRLSGELSAYFQYIPGFIFLQPQGTELTIRGAFPVFHYQQTDARLLGADLNVTYNLTSRLVLTGQGAVVRARDLLRRDFLPWIPADRIGGSLTYQWPQLRQLRNLYLSVGTSHVRQQTRVPTNREHLNFGLETPPTVLDFAAPPPAYTLWRLDAGTTLPLGPHQLGVTVSVTNLLNTRYRDYLNRLRYYADDTGRNLTIRLHYSF